MKFSLKRIKQSFAKSMESDFSMRIYAIILAIIAWFIISIVLYPKVSTTVKDVPVAVSLSGSIAAENGLSIISQDTQSVVVTLEGNRTVVGNIKAADLLATVGLGSVNESGEYSLDISVVSASGKEFSVTSITPSILKVTLDKVVTKTFDITAEAPSIKADTDNGYTRDEPVAVPNTVEISGPELQVNKITKCVVKNETLEILSESKEFTSGNTLILYNGTTVLENDVFTVTNPTFSIEVPISIKKTLSLKPAFKNYPVDFPIEDMQYTLDVTEVEVAAPNDLIKNIGELSIGTIDLHEVDIGKVMELPIVLPEGYRNLSGIDKVTITFASEGLAKKRINIKGSDLTVINAPPGFDINTKTAGYSVTFVGPTDIIKELTIQDIDAVIDLSSVDITSSEYYNAPVIISVPNKGCVWALGGNYAATVEAREKQPL